ncbi:YdeI/OmpD-associated family protein [Shimia isoporae]|nr:YdeI/OmpD-associated family protein [Shimia isoporae]
MLWDWLEANASRRSSLWLVTYKRHQGAAYVSRDEVLDALVAFGWIDGRRMALDDARTMQLIGPRKQNAWAESYCERAERLIENGWMRPRGLQAVTEAKEAGLWRASPHVDKLVVPEDLAQALAIVGGARALWDAAPPAYRRNVLRWIDNARKSDTRARRVAVVVDTTARNQRVPQM